MQVAQHRTDRDASGRLDIACLQAGFEEGEAGLHGAGGDQHFRHEILALFEKAAHLGHGGNHALLQNLLGGESGGQYNPQTVVTVSGVVVSKTQPSVQQGLPYLVYLTLETEAGQIAVFLGPSVYVDQLPMTLKALDRIQVTGSKVMWGGKPVILAAEVKTGGQVLKVRDRNGVPVWSGRPRN